MKLKTTFLVLVLLAVVSSAAFAAPPPTVPQPSQVLLAQIFEPASTTPAPTPAGTLLPPTLNSICSPCTQANCTRICHQTAFCSFDPDTGCSFCSCFLN